MMTPGPGVASENPAASRSASETDTRLMPFDGLNLEVDLASSLMRNETSAGTLPL